MLLGRKALKILQLRGGGFNSNTPVVTKTKRTFFVSNFNATVLPAPAIFLQAVKSKMKIIFSSLFYRKYFGILTVGHSG